MPLYADAVLAGAYRGARRDLTKTLYHAVSDKPVAAGRLHRNAFEALCNPALDLSGQQLMLARVDCPRCREIVARLVGGTVVPG